MIRSLCSIFEKEYNQYNTRRQEIIVDNFIESIKCKLYKQLHHVTDFP